MRGGKYVATSSSVGGRSRHDGESRSDGRWWCGLGCFTGAAYRQPVEWKFETRGTQFIPCEQVVFSSSSREVGTFTSDYGGDAGTWVGGKSTISMQWTAGPKSIQGQVFNGNWDRSRGIYKGTVYTASFNQKGLLLHKAGC